MGSHEAKLKGGGGGRSRVGGRGGEVMKHNFLKLKGGSGGCSRAGGGGGWVMKHNNALFLCK